jgi:hypothetical protein
MPAGIAALVAAIGPVLGAVVVLSGSRTITAPAARARAQWACASSTYTIMFWVLAPPTCFGVRMYGNLPLFCAPATMITPSPWRR